MIGLRIFDKNRQLRTSEGGFYFEVIFMSAERKIRVSKNLAKDPNYIAYQKALKDQEFERMEPGTYVAYHEGQLVGTGMDREAFFNELRDKGVEGCFFHQVGIPERVVDIPAPLSVGRGRRR